jgi:hypothetical protein
MTVKISNGFLEEDANLLNEVVIQVGLMQEKKMTNCFLKFLLRTLIKKRNSRKLSSRSDRGC